MCQPQANPCLVLKTALVQKSVHVHTLVCVCTCVPVSIPLISSGVMWCEMGLHTIGVTFIILLLYRMCGNITSVVLQLLPAQQWKQQLTERCRYWTQLLPHILVNKPQSDLCRVCHQNSTTISKLANKPDEEKTNLEIQVN